MLSAIVTVRLTNSLGVWKRALKVRLCVLIHT
jgi:hypothetical protein